jgi:hypothetical protein
MPKSKQRKKHKKKLAARNNRSRAGKGVSQNLIKNGTLAMIAAAFLKQTT